MIDPMAPAPSVAVSIISHGHGSEVDRLLGELAALDDPRLQRVIVTLNQPEPGLVSRWRGRAWPFDLVPVERLVPLGFGANHNRAFALDGARDGGHPLFAVLNPDLHLHADPFPALMASLATDARVGVAYPVQCDDSGSTQDYERLLPTPARLLRRHLLRRAHELAPGQAPDWVNAAFLLLRRDAYEELGGFDEGFHMYCEDVDLCLRLQLAGWRLARADGALVQHQAQRASRRRLQPLLWHARSLLRLWRSPVWRAWRGFSAEHALQRESTRSS